MSNVKDGKKWIEDGILSLIEYDLGINKICRKNLKVFNIYKTTNPKCYYKQILHEIIDKINDFDFRENFLRKLEIIFNLGELKKEGNRIIGTFNTHDYNLVIEIQDDEYNYSYDEKINNAHGEGKYKKNKNIIINYSEKEVCSSKINKNQMWYSIDSGSQMEVLDENGREFFRRQEKEKTSYYEDIRTKEKRATTKTPFYSDDVKFITYYYRQYGYLLEKKVEQYEDYAIQKHEQSKFTGWFIGADSESQNKKIKIYGSFTGINKDEKDFFNDKEKLNELYEEHKKIMKATNGHCVIC